MKRKCGILYEKYQYGRVWAVPVFFVLREKLCSIDYTMQIRDLFPWGISNLMPYYLPSMNPDKKLFSCSNKNMMTNGGRIVPKLDFLSR